MELTLTEFKPDGVTGGTHSDMFYRFDLTSRHGARFQLFRESHHTNEDLQKAKRYLRKNHDVVAIHVVREC